MRQFIVNGGYCSFILQSVPPLTTLINKYRSRASFNKYYLRYFSPKNNTISSMKTDWNGWFCNCLKRNELYLTSVGYKVVLWRRLCSEQHIAAESLTTFNNAFKKDASCRCPYPIKSLERIIVDLTGACAYY